MKALALVGSPRKGGNTDTLIDQVIRGAQSQDQETIVEKIYISDLDLHFCQGDSACRKTSKCIIADDMTQVLEKIKQADILILGSPLYRGYLPGQMKIFMDRTMPLEQDVEVEQKKKVGTGMKLVMGFTASLLPRKVQVDLMRKMAGGMGHLYRLSKKLNSVVIVVGAHPVYTPRMKRDLERTAEELSSFSYMTGGQVVASLLVPGVAKKGVVIQEARVMQEAFEAGKRLILTGDR